MYNCGYDIAADRSGNVYVIGSQRDSIMTDTGIVPNEVMYYGKFRSDSTQVWWKKGGIRPTVYGPWGLSIHSLGGVALDGAEATTLPPAILTHW